MSECLDMIKDPLHCKPEAFLFIFLISIHILARKETLLNIWQPLCLLFCKELRPGVHIAPDIYLKGLCCMMTEFLFGLYIYLSIHLSLSASFRREKRRGAAF